MFGLGKKSTAALEVKDTDGQWKKVPFTAGKTAMEAMKKAGLDIEASCGGECACSTCHVYVDPQWLAKLPAPEHDEETMIDYASNPKKNSRLACQIKLHQGLDGLKMEIAGE